MCHLISECEGAEERVEAFPGWGIYSAAHGPEGEESEEEEIEIEVRK